MPIPAHLGLCPQCGTRVSLEATFCLVCVSPFVPDEARRLAQEENEKAHQSKESEQKPDER